MRTLDSYLRNAIDIDGSYKAHIKAKIYPTRIYFTTGEINEDHPFTGNDDPGIEDDPVRQDIEWSPIDDTLVTFFCDGHIKWAKQGASTTYGGSVVSSVKPGVLGSKLYAGNSTTLTRYSITWTGNVSISSDTSTTVSHAIDAVHAVSSTECIAVLEEHGGFRIAYWNGSSVIESPFRFMFHVAIEPDPLTAEEIKQGKTLDTRTMVQKAIHSGAAKLGTKIFVYMTNAFSGMVEGAYYDLDTAGWSDIFTVLPTDLKVSLCEFRVCNVYQHNGTLYMAGQFRRTDNLNTSDQPYSMLLKSTNGKTFSINRPTLVSNIGYRFLARVGNNRLYLGNCNRVCLAPVTWFFDGETGTSGTVINISEDDIKGFTDSSLAKCTNLNLRSGLEQYFPSNQPNLAEAARLEIYVGLEVSPTHGDVGGDVTYVKYATYIVDALNYQRGVGRRGTALTATNEALYNLTGLSMPFYAEILGKSCNFDPMKEGISLLSAAGNGCLATNKISIDFWDHETYTDTVAGIDGINMNQNGGVNYFQADSAAGYPNSHYLGIITRAELQEKLALNDNPTITATTIGCKIYGWSHPTSGSVNDSVHVIIITEDKDGIETTHISSAAHHWPNTYPDSASGEEPISITMPDDSTTFNVGDKIKKVGVAFYADHVTWFNIARLEITSGIRAEIPLYGADTPWEKYSEEGGYKVPRAGKPYIMLASAPYNAFDFSISARFWSNMATTYDSHTGVVGLCVDGMNYVAGRWNRKDQVVELVNCKNGTETILGTPTAPGFTVNNTHQIRLDHKGGRFSIWMLDDAVGYYKEVFSYDWQDTDGYMFTSETASMKCGIYGFIDTPKARILSFYNQADEDGNWAAGIPFDPMWDPTTFPASGDVRIMDNIYHYYSQMAHPITPRGPYQFRQMGQYDYYEEGAMGLECRDFDYLASTTLDAGCLIALNSGASYVLDHEFWRPWTQEGGGPQVTLYNRALYYSLNPMSAQLFHSLSNKVWVVGGLLGTPNESGSQYTLDTKNGTTMIHSEGDFAVIEMAGEIVCRWFMGSGGEDDTTVSDMIQKVCDLSGAKCQFPSDYTDASQEITNTPYSILTINYAEGFDLSFDVASFGTGTTLSINFNAHVKAENYVNKTDFEDDLDLRLDIAKLDSNTYRYDLVSLPSGTILHAYAHDTSTSTQKFRVMVMKDNIGLYQNGQWVTTISTDEIVYEKDLAIILAATASTTLSNIKISDLSDWREAIYIDLETDGMSALNSIIQQRPVEQTLKSDGSLSFMYEPIRNTVSAIRQPRTHNEAHTIPAEGASDAIIYGLKDVKTIQNAGFAHDLGFATRMMRMPDLGNGAMRAARLILQKILEARIQHDCSIRVDLAVEPGDVYSFSYVAAGTGASVSVQMVVESCTLDHRVSGSKITTKMNITGRQYVATPS